MNVEDALDKWRAGNQAVFEHIHHALSRANTEMRNVTVAGLSADDGVEVVVGADKWVRGVSIDAKAYQKYDEASLGRAVVDACSAAKESVNRVAWTVIDREFGIDPRG
ncbi:MAG: YbaB/EbfC family nucleoid-associated protein [Micromonosporaceae bacterium]